MSTAAQETPRAELLWELVLDIAVVAISLLMIRQFMERSIALDCYLLALGIAYFFPRHRIQCVIVLGLVVIFGGPGSLLSFNAFPQMKVPVPPEVAWGWLIFWKLLIWGALASIVYACCLFGDLVKLTVFFSAFLFMGALAVIELTQKSWPQAFFIHIALSTPFYPFVAMIWRQYRGARFSLGEIFCNLSNLGRGTIPVPIMITDYLKDEPVASRAGRRISVLKGSAIASGCYGVLRFVIPQLSRKGDFWKFGLGAHKIYLEPWVPAFSYDFSRFSASERMGMVFVSHAAFLGFVGATTFTFVAKMRFLNMNLPPPINAPWKATSFYDQIRRWMHYYNEMLTEIYIEPLMVLAGKRSIRFPRFFVALGIFVGALVHHPIEQPLATYHFTLVQYREGFPSFVLYALLLAGFVYLSVRYERGGKRTPRSPGLNLSYLLIYVIIGYLARDFAWSPLSAKLRILR